MSLRTETNTQSVERQVRAAAYEQLGLTHYQTDFEHGQWWVTDRRTGAQWSVVDTNTGFDFEQVTRGED